jgi:hypothetical protein
MPGTAAKAARKPSVSGELFFDAYKLFKVIARLMFRKLENFGNSHLI